MLDRALRIHPDLQRTPLGSERIRVDLLKIGAIPVQPPMFRRDLSAIRICAELPSNFRGRIILVETGLLEIPVDQILHTHVAGCVLGGHDPMRATVEAGEVIETERNPVDLEACRRIARKLPRGQVPSRHVEAGAFQHLHSIEECGNKVDPPLVRKQAIRDVRHAEVIDAIRPPFGEAFSFERTTNTDETEIVNAMLQARNLVVANRIQGAFWIGLVWR